MKIELVCNFDSIEEMRTALRAIGFVDTNEKPKTVSCQLMASGQETVPQEGDNYLIPDNKFEKLKEIYKNYDLKKEPPVDIPAKTGNPLMVPCAICGTIFAKHGSSKYCSKKCKYKRNNDATTAKLKAEKDKKKANAAVKHVGKEPVKKHGPKQEDPAFQIQPGHPRKYSQSPFEQEHPSNIPF